MIKQQLHLMELKNYSLAMTTLCRQRLGLDQVEPVQL